MYFYIYIPKSNACGEALCMYFQQVIDLGIDGWKCDGTDPYILEVFDAQGTSGHVSRKQYSDMYYNDFFFYIRSKRGANDSLIWSRPVDGYVSVVSGCI